LAARAEIEGLLRGLYAARLRGDLDAVCRTFSEDAKFKIAGIGHHASPIAIRAIGIGEIRQWLALLIKTFQLSDQAILSIIVENDRAAAQWQANVYSRITGSRVPTDLVDMVEIRGGRIASYVEFVAPR